MPIHTLRIRIVDSTRYLYDEVCGVMKNRISLNELRKIDKSLWDDIYGSSSHYKIKIEMKHRKRCEELFDNRRL